MNGETETQVQVKRPTPMQLGPTELPVRSPAAKVAGRLHYAGFLKLYLVCAGICMDNAELTMEL